MIQWWSSLTGIEQVMACVAIPATVLLIVQTVMILLSFGDFGTDSGDISDVGDLADIGDLSDTDMSEIDVLSTGASALDGLQIFTIKGFVSFFTIFGWSGLLFLRMDLNQVLAIILAFVLGVITMVLMAMAFKAMMKLQDNGAVDTKTALGVSGVVYIKIPKNRSGQGKVNAVVSGRYGEFDAVTDDDSDLLTGTSVVVVSVNSLNVLVVSAVKP